MRTIQGEIEKALKFINNKKDVALYSSGRTDKGVHAVNQKAHFDLDIKVSLSKLKQALNTHTPNDIYIRDIDVVGSNFHSRYNSKFKEYTYKININEYNPIERNYIFQYNKKLNISEMKKGIRYFKGTHDFRSFSPNDGQKEDTIRTIKKVKLVIKDGIIEIRFLGTGFLKYQVRNMVGFLIEIGEGKRNYKDIEDVLSRKDRRYAGITANPEGLYLSDVLY